ncbi:MAG TPA: TadE/TadG family type IV pilus assembly protein [Polyangiaceae bacterium]|nr:TadE/TadG family type IV pilus assembly protein [Polyangiaceae bacterium]
MAPRLSASRLVRDTQGAAYVEFLIAFLPIFVLFMCIWQFGRIFTVRVLCTHAAIAGARAAAVVVAEPEDDGVVIHRVTDDKKQQITIAVYAALAPLIANDWLSSVEVDFPPAPGAPASGSGDLTPSAKDFSLVPPTMLHVRVSARYRCRLPFADQVMCDHANDSGWTFPVVAQGSFPYQAARYAYDPPTPPKPTDYDSATP